MTALNCKVGDLAIVVATELPENLGQIVEVLGVTTGVPYTLPGRGHIWQVRTVSGRATLVYRINDVKRFMRHATGPAPDQCLRPVSGLADVAGVMACATKLRPAPRRKRQSKATAEACERVGP